MPSRWAGGWRVNQPGPAATLAPSLAGCCFIYNALPAGSQCVDAPARASSARLVFVRPTADAGRRRRRSLPGDL